MIWARRIKRGQKASPPLGQWSLAMGPPGNACILRDGQKLSLEPGAGRATQPVPSSACGASETTAHQTNSKGKCCTMDHFLHLGFKCFGVIH